MLHRGRVFIAVGTPSRRGDGHADLSYVHAGAVENAAALTGFTVVITKSTAPVGTGDEVERIIRVLAILMFMGVLFLSLSTTFIYFRF